MSEFVQPLDRLEIPQQERLAYRRVSPNPIQLPVLLPKSVKDWPSDT